MNDSARKTALVTGASAGLGAELAWLFAKDGHDLVLVARRKDKLDALADEIKKKHPVTVHVIAEDLGKPGAAERVCKALDAEKLAIDFLVNNAGFGGHGAFAERDLGKELEMIQVNVITLVVLTHMLLPGMIARKSGRILNLGSTAGFLPGPFMAIYYASKAFVNSFTEALAVELGGTGVTATVSCPGATATEFAGVAGTDKSKLFQSGVMGSREVAEDAYKGMMRGQILTIPGVMNNLKIFSLRMAPRGVARSMVVNLHKNG